MDGNPGSEGSADGDSQREKSADGEKLAKEEKREESGGFSADAKWVVLLGVLSSTVAVLAYLGVQWPTLEHAISGSTPSPSPSVTQSLSTFPAPTFSSYTAPLPTVSYSPPPPSPTPSLSPTQVTSSPAVVPADFDNVATDPTQISAATMLPQQFDAPGPIFNQTSQEIGSCPVGDESTGVAATLSDYGCTTEVDGTYIDTSGQIQVAVWVIPFPNAGDAAGAYNALKDSGVDDWNIWCPKTGVGASVCQGAWRNATQGVWTGYCHRYLVRSLALVVSLPSNSSFQTGLTAAAEVANDAIGPQNIPGANCWPSTAVSQ